MRLIIEARFYDGDGEAERDGSTIAATVDRRDEALSTLGLPSRKGDPAAREPPTVLHALIESEVMLQLKPVLGPFIRGDFGRRGVASLVRLT
jgi:hypothetical protein